MNIDEVREKMRADGWDVIGLYEKAFQLPGGTGATGRREISDRSQ